MPKTALPPTIEANLAKWVVQRSTSAVPLSKADLRREAQIRYARHFKVSRYEAPEFNGSWVYSFIKRHPETEGCWGRGMGRGFRCRAGTVPVVDSKGNLSIVSTGKKAKPLQPRNEN